MNWPQRTITMHAHYKMKIILHKNDTTGLYNPKTEAKCQCNQPSTVDNYCNLYNSHTVQYAKVSHLVSIKSLCLVRPQEVINITSYVFSDQATWKERPSVSGSAMTCNRNIKRLDHWLQEIFLNAWLPLLDLLHADLVFPSAHDQWWRRSLCWFLWNCFLSWISCCWIPHSFITLFCTTIWTIRASCCWLNKGSLPATTHGLKTLQNKRTLQ